MIPSLQVISARPGELGKPPAVVGSFRALDQGCLLKIAANKIIMAMNGRVIIEIIKPMNPSKIKNSKIESKPHPLQPAPSSQWQPGIIRVINPVMMDEEKHAKAKKIHAFLIFLANPDSLLGSGN
ncbi:MAG: hypothetical protein LC097_09765 [Burkholderiales bacterium]|nr:hypothetical protein [Burkholderiales bacterium]